MSLSLHHCGLFHGAELLCLPIFNAIESIAVCNESERSIWGGSSILVVQGTGSRANEINFINEVTVSFDRDLG